jgi:hypothetical protein
VTGTALRSERLSGDLREQENDRRGEDDSQLRRTPCVDGREHAGRAESQARQHVELSPRGEKAASQAEDQHPQQRPAGREASASRGTSGDLGAKRGAPRLGHSTG